MFKLIFGFVEFCTLYGGGGGGKGGSPKPTPPPPPPVDNSAEVEAARNLELQKRKMGGRASTILTSDETIGDAKTTSSKLLGS